MNHRTAILVAKTMFTIALAAIVSVLVVRRYQDIEHKYLPPFSWEHLFLSEQQMALRTTIKNINHHLPSFDAFVAWTLDRAAFDQEKLRNVMDYFHRVIAGLPQVAEAYGILGYCYVRQGDWQKGVELLEKAVYLQPQFFWFRYNLGVLYVRAGRMDLAEAMLVPAVKQDPPTALALIGTSKIYQQLASAPAFPPMPKLRDDLRAGYRDALLALALGFAMKKQMDKVRRYANVAGEMGLDDDGVFTILAGEVVLKQSGPLTLPTLNDIPLRIF